MKTSPIGMIAKITFILFLYLFCYYFFIGLTTQPSEGDSLGYHIPIAKSIVNGQFLHPHYLLDREYFPGAAETILAIFLAFHIPLNLYNVFALGCLLFAGIYLGRQTGLEKSYALLFALTICTLQTVLRWVNAQTVDIWLAVFFMITLGLFVRPEKSLRYFFTLGIFSGLLFGTKYSGSAFALVLGLLFIGNIRRYLSVQRTLVFLIPFSLFGLFWYIRNYFVTGNPVYPQPLSFSQGTPFTKVHIWQAFVHFPLQMLNAMFLEYRIWSFALLIIPFGLFFFFYTKTKIQTLFWKVFAIGVIDLILFLFFPSAYQQNIFISNYRLGYPVFISFILFVFLFAKEKKKEETVAIIAAANMFVLPPLTLYPKLVLFYIPLALLIFRTKRWGKWFE